MAKATKGNLTKQAYTDFRTWKRKKKIFIKIGNQDLTENLNIYELIYQEISVKQKENILRTC